jgi:hypothetical protein
MNLFQSFQSFQSFKPPPLFLPRDAGEDVRRGFERFELHFFNSPRRQRIGADKLFE